MLENALQVAFILQNLHQSPTIVSPSPAKANLAAVLPEGYTILDNPAIRLAQAGIDLNSIINYDTGKSLAEELGVSLDVANINATNVAQQNQLVAEVIQGNRTPESAQKYLNEFTKLKSKSKASSRNNTKIKK